MFHENDNKIKLNGGVLEARQTIVMNIQYSETGRVER
jgi:hypothetical protein